MKGRSRVGAIWKHFWTSRSKISLILNLRTAVSDRRAGIRNCTLCAYGCLSQPGRGKELHLICVRLSFIEGPIPFDVFRPISIYFDHVEVSGTVVTRALPLICLRMIIFTQGCCKGLTPFWSKVKIWFWMRLENRFLSTYFDVFLCISMSPSVPFRSLSSESEPFGRISGPRDPSLHLDKNDDFVSNQGSKPAYYLPFTWISLQKWFCSLSLPFAPFRSMLTLILNTLCKP